MSAWITVDVDLWKHPKMAALPSDSARWGWIVALSEAKQQRKPGTFASDRHFREVAGRFGRFLPQYLALRLLDRTPDDGLAVHDWQRHQWSVTKTGQREDKERTTEGQEVDASRAVPVPVYVSTTEEGVQGEEPDALVTYHSLTGRFPTGNVRTWLDELAAIHGHEDTGMALATEYQIDANLRDLLSRTGSRLERDAHAFAKRRAEREAKRAAEERALIESMPEEQRTANLRRLGDEMARIGIPGIRQRSEA